MLRGVEQLRNKNDPNLFLRGGGEGRQRAGVMTRHRDQEHEELVQAM